MCESAVIYEVYNNMSVMFPLFENPFILYVYMIKIYKTKKLSTSPCLNYVFERWTFVGSAWSFGVFIPATTANDYPRLYPLHFIFLF